MLMQHHTSFSISFRPFLFPSLVMILLGWGGLFLLFYFIKPTVWGRWTFYVLWLTALTGTALPVVHLFHYLSPAVPPSPLNVTLRQALWVGIYGATLAWLTLNDLTNLWVIVGLAVGIGAVEYFIRLRERSQWRPPAVPRPGPSDESSDHTL